MIDHDRLSAGALALLHMYEGRLQMASDTMRAGTNGNVALILGRFHALLSQEPDRKNVQRLMTLVMQDYAD